MAILQVLNCSHNEITGALTGLSSLEELQALILSHNNITAADSLKKLVKLNTLVRPRPRLATPASAAIPKATR